MNRLFKRSEECTKMLIEGSEIYSKKKEQREFVHYVYTYIGERYKKCAEAYFSEAPAHGYVETIMGLSNKLELLQATQGSESTVTDTEAKRWELIQALAIGVRKPKLLFRADGPMRYKTVCKFEHILQEIYQEWDTLQEELDLCHNYMQRGTVRLNRPPEKDHFGQERGEMAKDINKIYRAYYYQLMALGLQWKTTPPVVHENSNLFLNIMERPWLRPLAHVILIRDAQAQMMGKEKYRDSELLFGRYSFLDMGALTQEQKKTRDELTTYYALRIRDILAKYLKGKNRTDCRSAFSSYFQEEYKKKKEKIEGDGFYDLDIWNSIAAMNARAEFMEKVSIFEVPDFSVPSCHVKETALKLAHQLKMSPDQLRTLEKAIPKALWGQGALEKALNAFEGETKDKLAERLNPLRTLVNAKEYYADTNTKNAISQKILDAAVKIHGNSSKSFVLENKDAKMSLAWNVYKDMIYFGDLTRSALLLSQAVDPCTAPAKNWFKFFRHCKLAMDHALKKYQSFSYIKQALGISKISKKVLRELNYMDGYDKLRKKLMDKVAGVKSEDNLSQEGAVKFLQQIDRIAVNAKQKVNGKAQWEIDIQGLGQDQEKQQNKHLCFSVYLSLACKAVSIIEENVMNVLLSNALYLYRHKRDFKE